LKRIFDINALDLAKVGKAFGFATPPRVDVKIGKGKGGAGKSGKKRRREESDEEMEFEEIKAVPDEDLDDGNGDGENNSDDDAQGRSAITRRQSKQRRIEVLGRKKVKKEFYKKGKDRRRIGSNGQWGR
jgi:ATP-dependent RNA helicase DDX18/HAS1